MNKLILTVGLPRIGKSTWCKQVMKRGIPIVNPDSIRLAIHGQPFISDAEPYVWATAMTMTKSLFLAGHKKVVVDATNTTRSRRDFWKSPDWIREYKVFGSPDDMLLCMERAKESCETDGHYMGLTSAIKRMADNWEPVEEDEWDAVSQIRKSIVARPT